MTTPEKTSENHRLNEYDFQALGKKDNETSLYETV